MVGTQLERRDAAHAVADGHHLAEAERADQEGDVIDIGADGIRPLRLVALAVAAQVERDHAMPPREVLRLRGEERAVAGPAVDEDEGRPAFAPTVVCELDSVVGDRRHGGILLVGCGVVPRAILVVVCPLV